MVWFIISHILKRFPFLCHQHVELLKEHLLIGTFPACLKMMSICLILNWWRYTFCAERFANSWKQREVHRCGIHNSLLWGLTALLRHHTFKVRLFVKLPCTLILSLMPVWIIAFQNVTSFVCFIIKLIFLKIIPWTLVEIFSLMLFER